MGGYYSRMSDAISKQDPKVPSVLMRWVELPTGDTLCVQKETGDAVEGCRTLPTGKKVRFTGSREAWSQIVAKYGAVL